jgi:hypothetical protein
MASQYAGVFWLLVVAYVVARQQMGWAGFIAVCLGLYYILCLFNALERRDKRDRNR